MDKLTPEEQRILFERVERIDNFVQTLMAAGGELLQSNHPIAIMVRNSIPELRV